METSTAKRSTEFVSVKTQLPEPCVMCLIRRTSAATSLNVRGFMNESEQWMNERGNTKIDDVIFWRYAPGS